MKQPKDTDQPTQETKVHSGYDKFDISVPDPPASISIPVVEVKTETTSERLDKAASDILQALPDHIVTAVSMAADSLHVSIWQEIAGLLVSCFNSGMLYAPVLDPAWSGDVPIREKESVCPMCEKVYTPKYRRQVYCSNTCGSKALIQRVSV
jgi:hypothetical protein